MSSSIFLGGLLNFVVDSFVQREHFSVWSIACPSHVDPFELPQPLNYLTLPSDLDEHIFSLCNAELFLCFANLCHLGEGANLHRE